MATVVGRRTSPHLDYRCVVAVVIVCALGGIAAALQQPAPPAPQPPPAFRTGATFVEVDVIVKDKAGRFVGNLARSDFEVSEEGAPQAIETFYVVDRRAPLHGSGAPPIAAAAPPVDADAARRVFIVWFDLEHMAVGSLHRAREAATDFFSANLRPGDVGGVVAGGTMANNRLTSVPAELEAAIRAIQPLGDVRSRELDMRMWPRFLSLYEAFRVDAIDESVIDFIVARACAEDQDQCKGLGGTLRVVVQEKGRLLYAEARLSTLHTLKTFEGLFSGFSRLPGRKTIIYLSDGFVSEDLAGQMRDVIGRAARVNTRIYAIDTRGLNRGSADSSIIDQPPRATTFIDVNYPTGLPQVDMLVDGPNSLAVDTGGLVIRNENDFAKALVEIADDTSSYYVLGYQSSAGAPDGKFHAINVRVKRSGLSVRARKGYLASAAPAVAVPQPLADVPVPPSPTLQARAEDTPKEAPVSPASTPLAAGPLPPATPRGVLLPLGPATGGIPSTVDSAAIRLRPSGSEPPADVARLRERPRGADPGVEAPSASLAEQFQQGWAAYQRGDTKAARAALAVPAENPSAPPWVNYVLGWAAFAEGDFVAARNAWNVVRTVAPEFEPVYFDIADAYLRQQKAPEALVLLRNAQQRWPADLDVLNAVGVVQVALGQLDEAITLFARALDMAPDDVTARFNLAAASERRYVRFVTGAAPSDSDRATALGHYRRVAQNGGALAVEADAGARRLEPLDVRRVTFDEPVRVASIGRAALRGQPARLAWSPDGRQIYVLGMDLSSSTEGHVLVTVATGALEQARYAPDWARPYWLWKCARRAPWLPSAAITSEARRFTNFNMTDPGNSQRAFARSGGQTVSNVLLVHDEVVAEASPSAVVPGLTFSWSPFAMGAIAFATPKRRLVILDFEGRKLEVAGTSGVYLPGWSEDGTRIAYLKTEGGAYGLYLVTVGAR